MYCENYDVVVIGGGHAGCEAALAASRLGCRTLLLNHHMDNTALMPCNPSIGGPAKGHLVREVSALGGEQARAADAATLAVRWLNTSKGAAVRALRAQCDPARYAAHYLRLLQTAPNLEIHQDEALELHTAGGAVTGVGTRHGSRYGARSVVLCSGTYLASRVHVGDACFASGPMGQASAPRLFDALVALGLQAGRMRTDTSPRLNGASIDFSRMTRQSSDERPLCFDFWGEGRVHNTDYACYFSHTTPETHAILAANIRRSPLVTGAMDVQGPRYCPSIEDKFLRFPDRDTHPIVFEPLSDSTKEVYIQNFSTSLPYDAQVSLVRSLPGCARASILKPGYAIEYAYLKPDQLAPTLESKAIGGFFCAGQVNGTSGYEEAASQGLLAGINAALRARDAEPVVLSRSGSYLGVLVDDLTTKSTDEPYRMLTSRCEHRLLLRHDNADRRCAPIARRIGLLDDARWEVLTRHWERSDEEIRRLETTRAAPSEALDALLAGIGADPLLEPVSWAALLRRRNVDYALVEAASGPEKFLDADEALYVETELRYAGYVERQERMAAKMAAMDGVLIPADFDYARVRGMLTESRQKLERFRPRSLGQALRISGVTPADVQLLAVVLKAASHR